MRETQRIVSEIPWSNESFAIALTYINWETDAIVGGELIRNVGIAIACIFVTTLITLGKNILNLSLVKCICVPLKNFDQCHPLASV